MQPPYSDFSEIQEKLFLALEGDKPEIFYKYIHGLIAQQYSLKTFIITYCSQGFKHLDDELVYGDNVVHNQEIITNIHQCPTVKQYLYSLSIEKTYQEISLNKLSSFYQEKTNKLYLFPIFYRSQIISIIYVEIPKKELSLFNKSKLIKVIFQNLALLFINLDIQKKQENLIKEKETQNNYLSKINHEIRTPIASVIGFSKMLKQQIYGELNPKQLQYANAIYESANYLLELVIDLLDIAKLEANKEKLYLEKLLVKNLCQSCLSFIHVKILHKNLDFQLIIEDNINYIYADERKIKQILINLLSNAVKFTTQGSVTLKVSSENKNIKFSVIDTGIGIKPEDHDKLFQPFAQIKTCIHDQEKGTGLGLVISQELAKLHGGDITFTSDIGKGSCFTLVLPMD
ncbi:Circadian input kinase A [Cyanobacterium sp. HL-69]|uniref:sensor histidine kinase n=1 Tax=Cyanobacterium sp. HL-69 TaxID=2054282 RepID=UPI000CA0DF19|nr:Circadian input kinase A [Cyanobacterium sp. HL-69]